MRPFRPDDGPAYVARLEAPERAVLPDAVDGVVELLAGGTGAPEVGAPGPSGRGGAPGSPARPGGPAPEDAPFDRILVSAEAERLPMELTDQLADGGVMVIPVRGTMLRVTREGDDAQVTRHGGFAFVPLIED